MKKILPVIIGFLTGIITSACMIFSGVPHVAHGEENVWDSIVAYGDFFDWNDIFTPSGHGLDMYYLVLDKLLVAPGKDALKEVAQKYGLTKDEAQRVVNGSITPLFNITDRRSAKLTQEDAYILAQNLQNDYNDIKELFDLEQRVDVEIAPSEIFANGDLYDSGFDLIHDLSVLEEVLFVDITENVVGLPFSNQLDSPYLPTENEQTLENYVPQSGPAAILEFGLEEDTGAEGGGNGIGNNETFGGETGVTAGGLPVESGEVIEEDICQSDDDFSTALKDYEENKAAAEEAAVNGSVSGGTGGVGESETAGTGPEFEAAPAAGTAQAALSSTDGVVDENGNVLPATASNWLKSWCPSLAAPGDTGAAAGSTFGEAGFSSLGGFTNSLIGQAAGAAAWVQGSGFSLGLGICLDTKVIKKTVTSYLPGDSCVLCEIEKINEIMDKTLSHSLIPNKVTGNIMESAKCKDSYQALLDIQFIAIAAPVPSPSNDDVIFGKNIFEEWKKFVDRYQPLLFPDTDSVSEFELEAAPEDSTQEGLILSINKILNRQQAEAKQEIESLNAAGNAQNITFQAQTILNEIHQMRVYFEGYLKQYNKINQELCPAILSKQDI
ncbi:MAG: hypothetical protein ABIH78_04550 [Candidatus Peregrinibacteria bacterium]